MFAFIGLIIAVTTVFVLSVFGVFTKKEMSVDINKTVNEAYDRKNNITSLVTTDFGN